MRAGRRGFHTGQCHNKDFKIIINYNKTYIRTLQDLRKNAKLDSFLSRVCVDIKIDYPEFNVHNTYLWRTTVIRGTLEKKFGKQCMLKI